ncbi:MAG: GTPase HflX [Phycisphaerales bacterium]
MPQPNERTSIKVQSERAVLAAVRLPDAVYDQRDPFGELKSLAQQAGAIIVGELEQRKQKPEPATFIGSGKLDELKGLCELLGASLVIFDHDLSPRQIANIEEVVGRKVIDRSELILDIFASRATTHEAKLQVEMAQMEYTYPRLRAMWDHLERIVGAGGIAGIGTRGPGEQQLEIDRRLVQRKKLDLKRELDDIHARKRRMVRERKLDHFTVGIVGYTNAGKSTLFNTLTGLGWGLGGAYADDRLFATLVTRTRDWDLGGGLRVMLSDTVGFVRDLPHHLVASFRATLEEAIHADLLLIVLDASDPAADLQFDAVTQTLDDLLAEAESYERQSQQWGVARSADGPQHGLSPTRVLLLNKVDRLKDNREILAWQRRADSSSTGSPSGPADSAHLAACIPISAIDPAHPGHEQLRDFVRSAAQGGVLDVTLRLALKDAKAINIVENRALVLAREYDDGFVRLRVRIGRRQLDQLRSTTGRAVQVLDHTPGA